MELYPPKPSHPTAPAPHKTHAAQPPEAENQSKSYVGASLISYFLGCFGIDRFYLGYTGLGIAKLLTFGGLGIWAYVENWLIVFGVIRQKGDRRPLEGYAQYGEPTKIILGIILGLQLLLIPIAIFFLIFLSIPALQQNVRDSEARNQELQHINLVEPQQ